jgi:hypothetical protein
LWHRDNVIVINGLLRRGGFAGLLRDGLRGLEKETGDTEADANEHPPLTGNGLLDGLLDIRVSNQRAADSNADNFK